MSMDFLKSAPSDNSVEQLVKLLAWIDDATAA